MKKEKNWRTKALEALCHLLVRCAVLLVVNPIVFPIMVLFAPKRSIKFACKHVEENSITFCFVKGFCTRTSERTRYLFHLYTRLKYAGVSLQVWMIYKTEDENDFYQMYSDKNVNHQVKKVCFWRNSSVSEEFRLHMMKNGYVPDDADLRYAFVTKQSKVIRELVKQTISDEQCICFWENANDKDESQVLSVLIDYIVREGLTPRVTSYVMQSHDCIAKKAVSKALDTHKAIAFIKRSKPNNVFRQLLIKGVHIPYEAQCLLTADLYKIYKECRYELVEKAVIYHLQNEGEMAREILFEEREFSSDVMNIITQSRKLSSWYLNRV